MNDDLLLAQKPLVDSYLSRGPRPLSCFSFAALFAWCDFFDFEFKIIEDRLCIFAHGEGGCFLYLPPLGGNFGPSVVTSAFAHMIPVGTPKPVNRIENIPENLLYTFGSDGYNQSIKPVEYVYRKDDLIALKGNSYKSQRHDCNGFTAHSPKSSFGPYTDADFDGCMVLYDRWARRRAQVKTDGVYRSMLQENRLVHARLLKFRQALGLSARVLKAGGEVIGYTFGFAVDDNTFCVYAEIADVRFMGAAAYMFRAFCADADLNAYSRINTMDDFAMPNVARTKLAYHPSEFISSYTVSLRTGKHP
jgi:hypothetical protein